MRSYELQPTYDNLLKTYLDDTISRDRDIHAFADILNSLEDHCSIALDGAWGSGKTFFVKQVKMLLDAHNEFVSDTNPDDVNRIKGQWKKYHGGQEAELQTQVCVYYDAWENDNDDDPVLSLVYSILQSIDTDFELKKSASSLKLAATIFEFFSGKKWRELAEVLKSEDLLSDLREKKNIHDTINEFLNSLLEERGNRLVIFIDELDRCKPDYTVRVLERIKHYFSNDRITFVFSTNIGELQHTIKKCYGNDFNACKYLDRFFDLRVTLPPADLQKYYLSIEFDSSYYTYDIVTDAVIKTYHFELREIAKYIKLTKVAAYDPTHKDAYRFAPDKKEIEFCLLYIVPVMIGLKIADADRYRNFIQGRDHTPLTDVAYCLTDRFFEDLLNRGETFEANENAKVVRLEDKLKEVYDAIFGTAHESDNYYISIGKFNFDKRTKDVLMRTEGLLSGYANYDL